MSGTSKTSSTNAATRKNNSFNSNFNQEPVVGGLSFNDKDVDFAQKIKMKS